MASKEQISIAYDVAMNHPLPDELAAAVNACAAAERVAELEAENKRLRDETEERASLFRSAAQLLWDVYCAAMNGDGIEGDIWDWLDAGGLVRPKTEAERAACWCSEDGGDGYCEVEGGCYVLDFTERACTDPDCACAETSTRNCPAHQEAHHDR